MMKVSVALITYNHEKYIAQALESILKQDVDFQYEIIVGEDCSPDNTRQIVLAYQQKYPGIITTVFSKKNRGARKNFIHTIDACKGEYIAYLDGDDYWTSPLKLKRQTAFLDRHKDCSICAHAFHLETGKGKMRTIYPPGRHRFYTFEDLLSKHTFMHSGSTMFRRSLFKGFPEWFKNESLKVGDWPFYVIMAKNGNIGYLNEDMVYYRVHDAGMWSLLGDIEQAKLNIRTREIVRPHLQPEFNKYITKYLASQYLYLSQLYRQNGDWPKARKYFKKSLQTNLIHRDSADYKDLLYTMLYLCSPRYSESLKSKMLSGN